MIFASPYEKTSNSSVLLIDKIILGDNDIFFNSLFL